MSITRRGTFKALAATVASIALPLPESAKIMNLPVTPHATGKCPGGAMCWDCYDVMEDDYEDALAPVVERALAAFWRSVHEDLPFFEKTDSLSSEMADAAREAVAYGSFDQWQATPEAQKIRATLVTEAQ